MWIVQSPEEMSLSDWLGFAAFTTGLTFYASAVTVTVVKLFKMENGWDWLIWLFHGDSGLIRSISIITLLGHFILVLAVYMVAELQKS